MKFFRIPFSAAAAAAVFLGSSSPAAAHPGDSRGRSNATSANWAPGRTEPVKRGEFQVDLVVIAFPDCEYPSDVQEVKRALSRLGGGNVADAEKNMSGGQDGDGGGFTITDYYKEYSQGLTWPVLAVYPSVYMAPQPLGYYCRWDHFSNPIGFKGDGGERARKLREDALKFAKSRGGLPKAGAFTCWVYCRKLNWAGPDAGAEKMLRPHYPKPKPEELEQGARDRIRDYRPPIPWGDPLWPNSAIQVHYPGNGGVMVHEIGHCLGAPDFYHASEERDGMPGEPALAWSYGPTGPAYCRWKYQAFVPREAYPVLSKSGTYTIGRRSGKFPRKDAKPKQGGGRTQSAPPVIRRSAGAKDGKPGEDGGPLPLGCFIPTTHPNYILCVEYCHDEKRPVGHPGAEGLLVQAINVTMGSPMMGPPDLCYIYRRDDSESCKGLSHSSPYLRAGDTFTTNSNPAAILPNRLPAGVEITNICENADGSCTFGLKIAPPKLQKKDLDFSLLPQTRLVAVDQALPTSFRAELDVLYRGEPLLAEYGFCVGTRKDPELRNGIVFPLHHRDRYDARIIDLAPGTTYFIRAYAKSEKGVRYSENQKKITMPAPYRYTERETPALFSRSDRLLDAWYVKRHHFGASGGVYRNANAILALAALANYYRAVPGETARPAVRLASPSPHGANKGKRNAGEALDMQNVHCNPSDSRPRWRMADTEKLISRMTRLAGESWLNRADFHPPVEPQAGNGKKKRQIGPKPLMSGKKDRFGRYSTWVSHCAAALKVKKPEDVFVVCETPEELEKQMPRIKEWIMRSQPVMFVRESGYIGQETENRHPLDTVFIDGFDGERLHATFPLGGDRGIKGRGSSFLETKDLFDHVTGGVLMFYRPGNPPSRPPKIAWPPPPPPPARRR